MASGTIYGTTGSQYIDAKIEWSATSNVDTNKSTVTAVLYYKRNNTGYTTTGTGTFSVTIHGTKTSATKTLTITESAWVKACEATKTVTHNDNGTMSIQISAAGSIPDTSLSSTSVSQTVSLDTIPRETAFDSLSYNTRYFTATMTYKYTPKSPSVYNRCNIALNLNGTYIAVKTINLGKQTALQHTAAVTLSASERAIIYNNLTNTDKGVLRFTMRTYSDSGYTKQIGNGQYKEITLYVHPSSEVLSPTATMTLAPVNSLASPFNKLYIQGKTKVKITFTDLKAQYGASIESCYPRVDGRNLAYSANQTVFTSGYITSAGSIPVLGFIKDSRGTRKVYEQSINVIPYNSPRIFPISGESEVIAARCDANGNLTDSGAYLKIKARRGYSKVESGGTQHNFCSIRYSYKATGGSWSAWTTILANNAAGDEITTDALLGGALDPTKSYSVRVGVVDTLGESEYATIPIPTDKVSMHRAGSIGSFAIGKYAEDPNTVDIAEDKTTLFRGKVRFMGEAWTNLGLSANVAESESNAGRWGGTGCYYRVCAGEKHVYVAFNCAFTYSGSAIQVNLDTIPSAYRPKRNVYAICATGGLAVARILVTKEGNVLVDWIQIISPAEATASSTVKWIDGYIDYWT